MAKAAPSAAEATAVEGQPFIPHQQQLCYGIPATPPQQPYILLPIYRRRLRRPCHCCRSFTSASSVLLASVSVLLFLVAAAFFLWPSDPHIRVVRIQLDDIRVTTRPLPSVDVSMKLEVRVRNPDFFSLDYQSVIVSIFYRGRQLGFVTADGGHIRARGVSYVKAHLKLDGIRVFHDAWYLIEDLAKGSIPLDTVTEIDGRLHAFFFDIPIQGRVACAIHVNPENQTVVRQDCYL